MGILYKEEAFQIMGACFEVYNYHRHGFSEAVYHESLVYELAERKIPAISQPQLEIHYKGRSLNKGCEPDFVCFRKIILEIKALADLRNEHRAQVLNYLKATGFQLGLLVNFGKPGGLQWERVVLTDGYDSSPRLQQ
jgi:GxxExxY protein